MSPLDSSKLRIGFLLRVFYRGVRGGVLGKSLSGSWVVAEKPLCASCARSQLGFCVGSAVSSG